MRKRYHFFKNIGTIILIAFLGTFISIVVTSSLVWLVGVVGISNKLSIKASWAFGSLISATDPVCVLAIFKMIDADDTLFSLIFGESILNDAISIVMYRTIRGMAFDSKLSKELIITVYKFIVLCIGSALIGILTALTVAFLMKKQVSTSAVNYKTFEMLTMCLCPWVSYLMAEGQEMSGIVAILVNGIMLARYAAPNLSAESRRNLRSVYATAAALAETLVFIFLGMGIFAFNHPHKEMGAVLLISSILIINIARYCNVTFVCALSNSYRNKHNEKPIKKSY